jgi:DNA topoisomerase I
MVTAEIASEAGLRYTPDGEPGITRGRRGKGFVYLDHRGERVTDAATLSRIRAMAIPPAWTKVWISRYANGHLQATGRDARGRKQAIYHERWRSHRDETKFHRMAEFGQRLPAIRAQIQSDLGTRGLSRDKVAALVVHLLESTLIRVGNPRYAKENESYGLTTLSPDHLQAGTEKFILRFKGKSGRFHEIEHRDRRIVRLVRQCQELPGQCLFTYLGDDGEPRDITSADVNEYIRQVAGQGFSAKDFRTWAASVEALRMRREHPEALTTFIVKSVAQRLGNTPSVCRKSYIVPVVLVPDFASQPWFTAPLPRPTKQFPDPYERLALAHIF